jgi:ribosomal protein S18 acetylase RimI-like enzyme
MQSIDRSFETKYGIIVIRAAIPVDVIQYREMRLFALQEAPTAFSADYQADLNRPMSFWEDRLNFDEYGILFFAEHAGNLIGMTGSRQRESPKTKHSAEIFSVYVRPEWRGLHIAEALIDGCVQWAKTREVNILKLGVMTTNTSAVRCYERCGFKIYGTEPRDIFYAGRYYDLHLMYRDIM